MLNNIEVERVRSQLTREEISKRLGVSTRTYRNWVGEKTDIPGTALIKLSRIFQADISYLMQGCVGVEEKEVV